VQIEGNYLLGRLLMLISILLEKNLERGKSFENKNID
jgi:hypothetical protein